MKSHAHAHALRPPYHPPYHLPSAPGGGHTTCPPPPVPPAVPPALPPPVPPAPPRTTCPLPAPLSTYSTYLLSPIVSMSPRNPPMRTPTPTQTHTHTHAHTHTQSTHTHTCVVQKQAPTHPPAQPVPEPPQLTLIVQRYISAQAEPLRDAPAAWEGVSGQGLKVQGQG